MDMNEFFNREQLDREIIELLETRGRKTATPEDEKEILLDKITILQKQTSYMLKAYELYLENKEEMLNEREDELDEIENLLNEREHQLDERERMLKEL